LKAGFPNSGAKTTRKKINGQCFLYSLCKTHN
jgi:hypothetical protein